VIPLRITGTLGAPKVGVDIADAVKERVVEDLKGRLLKELEKGEEPVPEGEEKEKDAEDILKDKLKDLLGRCAHGRPCCCAHCCRWPRARRS
jgi:hypothetical protein